jgi:hypothetical protein
VQLVSSEDNRKTNMIQTIFIVVFKSLRCTLWLLHNKAQPVNLSETMTGKKWQVQKGQRFSIRITSELLDSQTDVASIFHSSILFLKSVIILKTAEPNATILKKNSKVFNDKH